MKFQQTAKSQPGGGPRAQGVRIPDAATIVECIGKDTLDDMVEERHPGLRKVLATLSALLGSGLATAEIPADKLRKAAIHKQNDLDLVMTELSVIVSSTRGVAVLHKILALGVDAYLGEDDTPCKHCDEPLHHRTTPGGDDVVWFHRGTGKIMCADGAHVATKRRRPPRETS